MTASYCSSKTSKSFNRIKRTKNGTCIATNFTADNKYRFPKGVGDIWKVDNNKVFCIQSYLPDFLILERICKNSEIECGYDLDCAENYLRQRENGLCQQSSFSAEFAISEKDEKRSNKVRSRMEGSGLFFKISTHSFDCFGFCIDKDNI